jgi:ArsR family transcriptional regulator, arsenate/arsenite/antimonite-responsive transcriptional repressor
MDLVWKSKPTLDAHTEVELAGYLRALSHPVRLRLLRALLEQPEVISGDLASSVPLSPSTVSEHLRVLRAAGLVGSRGEGPRRYYSIQRETWDRLRRLVRVL